MKRQTTGASLKLTSSYCERKRHNTTWAQVSRVSVQSIHNRIPSSGPSTALNKQKSCAIQRGAAMETSTVARNGQSGRLKKLLFTHSGRLFVVVDEVESGFSWVVVDAGEAASRARALCVWVCARVTAPGVCLSSAPHTTLWAQSLEALIAFLSPYSQHKAIIQRISRWNSH